MAGSRSRSTRTPDTAASAVVDQDEKVSLLLAHPLTPEQSARLGLERRDHLVNAEIEVNRDSARSIINAGYAQVDPEDTEAVREALHLPTPEEAAAAIQDGEQPGVSVASVPGEGDTDSGAEPDAGS